MTLSFVKQCAAEFVGTFSLIFVGGGVACLVYGAVRGQTSAAENAIRTLLLALKPSHLFAEPTV